MDTIIDYITEHKRFFLLIGIVITVYYIVFIMVYGFPFKINIKYCKIFNVKQSNRKIFNIFDKTKDNPSNKAESIESSNNEDWLDAFNQLEEQSSIIENDIEIDDFLEDQGILPPEKED